VARPPGDGLVNPLQEEASFPGLMDVDIHYGFTTQPRV
jgi:hypothetical protein